MPMLVMISARGGIKGAVPISSCLAKVFASWLSMQGRWKVELVPLATGGIVMLGDGTVETGAVIEHAFEAWSAVARGRD